MTISVCAGMEGAIGRETMTPGLETADLTTLARAALQRRDGGAALDLLNRIAPANVSLEVLLDKALALRMTGDLVSAVRTLDAALVLDPMNFLALLSKGALLERLGRRKLAAQIYKNALATAPPAQAIPPELEAPVKRAREVTKAHAAALADHLRSAVASVRADFPGEQLDRFDEALNIFAGVSRPYIQEPALLHYPRLPAIPFYDRHMFPWLETLEAATPFIREETLAVMADPGEHMAPYIAYPPGAPVNQWAELNHSPRWSAFLLWRDGRRQDGACERCPRTAALVESLPLARQPGFAPTVTLSVLEPHTHIPPHTGSANSRLLAHLPLVLPGPARFRVGAVTREWRMGEAWVFDDTIEHEAWNDADEPRAILILDIWNPFLTEAERALISAMMTANNQFLAAE